MIETFMDHYKAIEIETGYKANGIIGTIEEWVADLSNGTTVSNVEITPTMIAAAKTIRENEQSQIAAQKASEKSALLARLGITEAEAKLLLS